MGREVKRVPLDFDWPRDETWQGYLMPESLAEGKPCPAKCDNGYAPRAAELRDLWYGKIPFRPEDNGSTPFAPEHPRVWAFAERNVSHDLGFYRTYNGFTSTTEDAVRREAQRLAKLFNGSWSHHLNQQDVDALVEGGRLMDFTHTWSRETGWVEKDPPYRPTAAEVNEWSLAGMGHDSINCNVVVGTRCEREGVESTCPTCHGHAELEAYPGQREEQEKWERTEPPTGDGWQLWETVSEGSPISPVFDCAEALATWMTGPGYAKWSLGKLPDYDSALRFVKAGWAPSMIVSPEHGVEDGVNAVGREA